ncbi:MAG: hypothetical protein HY716_11145 [Planctomycetes bacterium]|nr:hypothetical protein [Planctomycetota bacterium]
MDHLNPPGKTRLFWIGWLAPLLLMGSLPAAQEPKAPDAAGKQTLHDEKCPGECAPCQEAIRDALDYLAGQQLEDGGLPAKNWRLRYVKSDKDVIRVMTTAVAGLAFLAHGSGPCAGGYTTQIAGIRDYLKARAREILEAKPRRIGGGGGPGYASAMCLLFFTHLYEVDRDEDTRAITQDLAHFVSACIGTEIHETVWKKRGGKDPGTVWYVSGVTALLNVCVISLGRARAAGFQVDNRPLELAKSYYATILFKNGSIKYDKNNAFPTEPRQGRTVAAILALMSLGDHANERYKPVLEYVRKNMEKTMAHHVPSLHTLLGAYTFFYLGQEDWKPYVDKHFGKLIDRQREDGSLPKLWELNKKLMMTPNDLLWGPNYATALFALILQIPTQRVQFFRAGADLIDDAAPKRREF